MCSFTGPGNLIIEISSEILIILTMLLPFTMDIYIYIKHFNEQKRKNIIKAKQLSILLIAKNHY